MSGGNEIKKQLSPKLTLNDLEERTDQGHQLSKGLTPIETKSNLTSNLKKPKDARKGNLSPGPLQTNLEGFSSQMQAISIVSSETNPYKQSETEKASQNLLIPKKIKIKNIDSENSRGSKGLKR